MINDRYERKKIQPYVTDMLAFGTFGFLASEMFSLYRERPFIHETLCNLNVKKRSIEPILSLEMGFCRAVKFLILNIIRGEKL